MYNWSTSQESLGKKSDQSAIWQLEQTANFGLNGEKISETELRHYWTKLNLDKNRRRFLELLIYDH